MDVWSHRDIADIALASLFLGLIIGASLCALAYEFMTELKHTQRLSSAARTMSRQAHAKAKKSVQTTTRQLRRELDHG